MTEIKEKPQYDRETMIKVKRNIMKLRLIAFSFVFVPLIIFLILLIFIVKPQAAEKEIKNNYGVFIGISSKDAYRLEEYDTVVIEPESFSKADIKKLHEKGKKVYGYISIGSLEDYRDYYNKYKKLALSAYDGWEGEYWVNVGDASWQKLMLKKSKEFKKKGIDGFFVDNADVYYHYPEKKIYNGLVKILKGMKKLKIEVIINGGDVFVSRYLKKNKKLTAVLDGINQENVFTKRDGDNLFKADDEDRDYFLEYLNKVEKTGAKIFLTEYASNENKDLRKEIEDYCSEKGWKYYITDDILLR